MSVVGEILVVMVWRSNNIAVPSPMREVIDFDVSYLDTYFVEGY